MLSPGEEVVLEVIGVDMEVAMEVAMEEVMEATEATEAMDVVMDAKDLLTETSLMVMERCFWRKQSKRRYFY